MNRYEVYKHACLIALALADCMLQVLYGSWIQDNSAKAILGWIVVYSIVIPYWRYETKEYAIAMICYLAYYFSFLTLFTKVLH